MNQEEKAWEGGKSCFWRSLFWPSLVFQHGGRGRHRKFYQYPYRAGMFFSRPNPY
jgi:hypothetical protein